MSELATDTNVVTKPSEWQVGDQLIRYDYQVFIYLGKNEKGINYRPVKKRPNLNEIFYGNKDKFIKNIDAERRALQAEIDRLNSKIELEIDKDYELSIQIDNLNDEIEVLQREKDPWCCDLEKAPYNQRLIILDNGSEVCDAVLGMRRGHDKGFDEFVDVDFHSLDDVVAWMPIPEPKKLTNNLTQPKITTPRIIFNLNGLLF